MHWHGQGQYGGCLVYIEFCLAPILAIYLKKTALAFNALTRTHSDWWLLLGSALLMYTPAVLPLGTTVAQLPTVAHTLFLHIYLYNPKLILHMYWPILTTYMIVILKQMRSITGRNYRGAEKTEGNRGNLEMKNAWSPCCYVMHL